MRDNPENLGDGPRSTHELYPFAELVGWDAADLIGRRSPPQVLSRVAKAVDHYARGVALGGVDDEMGAIRLIASEEELVVAIFEALKARVSRLPRHDDFVRHYRRHPVKLSLAPVLSTFATVLQEMLAGELTIDGLEDAVAWRVKPVVADDRVRLRLVDADGVEVLGADPLALAVSADGMDDAAVVRSLFDGLVRQVSATHGDLRAFVTERADYRNKLLYATDTGHFVMAETVGDLLPVFRASLRDLLWTLAVLVGADPPAREWGLASQVVGVYRLVLEEIGAVGRRPAASEPGPRR